LKSAARVTTPQATGPSNRASGHARGAGSCTVIALRTAKSITEPLGDLIKVTKQIGTAGDLDHEIDIKREDEIGELSRTFNSMVGYLREMASVSEAIAVATFRLRSNLAPRMTPWVTLLNAWWKV